MSGEETKAKVPGSDRSFGITFSFFFFLLGIYRLYSSGEPPYILFCASLGLMVVSFLRPNCLRKLNVLWQRYGQMMHRIMAPVMLGAIFYGILSPISMLRRLLGFRNLEQRIDKNADTYWKKVPEGATAKSSLRHQY